MLKHAHYDNAVWALLYIMYSNFVKINATKTLVHKNTMINKINGLPAGSVGGFLVCTLAVALLT